MQWMNAQMRWIAAGGVLVTSAGYAAVVTRTQPTPTGASPSQIRELASRIQEQELPQVSLSPVAPPSASNPIQVFRPAASPRPRQTATGPRTLNVPILPPGQPVTQVAVQRRPAPSAPSRPAPVVPAAPESPVKNIALMGVTHQDNRDVAWLVNLENQERDEVSVGEDGFGFQVKEIGPESVVLARGSEQFTVRLGDKQIPVNEAPVVASADTGEGGGGRRGRGQWGGGNGAGGWGGRGGGRGGFGQGGFGRGNQSNRGGRSFASNSFGNSAPVISGGNTSSSGGFQRGNRGTSGGFSGRTGGFAGGGFAGGGFGRGGFQNGGNNSQFAAGASGPTSNPQTARRRGGQLVGGADPIEMPQAITNPQTQRRLGTSSTGAAFGQGGASNGFGGNNRNGGNRAGGNRTGGFAGFGR